MGRGHLVVEGHGEVRAALNLVIRLWQDLQLPPLHWADPIRGRQLHTREGLARVSNLARYRDAGTLFVLRDEDDACPMETAPQGAHWLLEADLPFPAALVLLHREYETIFLPCAAQMAGRPLVDERGVQRPGLVQGASFAGDPEGVRGAKEWLSARFPPGRSYKPSLDQLPMTRMLDFEVLRQAKLPSFLHLERALSFLANPPTGTRVYPPPEAER